MPRSEDDYTRVYTDAGTVVHLLDPLLSVNNSGATSLCSRSAWPGYWHGTGTQEEHERAQDLTLCSSCRAIQEHRDGGYTYR